MIIIQIIKWTERHCTTINHNKLFSNKIATMSLDRNDDIRRFYIRWLLESIGRVDERGVKDGSLVTTSVDIKSIEWFGDLWPACTRRITQGWGDANRTYDLGNWNIYFYLRFGVNKFVMDFKITLLHIYTFIYVFN